MRAIEIETEQINGVVVISPSGRLDSGRIERLDQAINAPIDEGHHHLAIDFEEIEFIASSALRILLLSRKRVDRAQGAMVLCRMKPHVKHLFQVAGFQTMFRVEESLEDAINLALPPGAPKARLDSHGRPADGTVEQEQDQSQAQTTTRRRRRGRRQRTVPAALDYGYQPPQGGGMLRALGKPLRILRALWQLVRNA